MNSQITDNTKAVILLCSSFRKSPAKPLSLGEFTKLRNELAHGQMEPEDLFKKENVKEIAKQLGIEQERFDTLLGRGVQLGIAIEEWLRQGIWIISQEDEDYPMRYKDHLKDKAPPLLFGAGDRSLLKGGGVAIVGSRNVDKEGEGFARKTAQLCARNGMPVVSGGARGVDQISMKAALEAGGTVIGILAENMLKKRLAHDARNAIAQETLLLISPYRPDMPFSVGMAMSRNKLIYGMADYGLVVSSEYEQGGTWAGAKEELKRDNHRPIFVRTGKNTPSGNKELLALGAAEWPQGFLGEDNEPMPNFKKQLGKVIVEKVKSEAAQLSFETNSGEGDK